MGYRFATPAPEAYAYPLLIRHLLQSALDVRSPCAIVGTDGRRHDYAELGRRIGRLAAVLADHGVGPGDVVAVMDWDSHRYLEAYFAVPMMGAVLQTVNVRLSPEQIAYTLADTGARLLLFHVDFAALVQTIDGQLPALICRMAMHDGLPVQDMAVAGDYETLLAAGSDLFPFVDFDEHALATTFHTTGTTGLPKAVAFSHRQIVLHTLAVLATMAGQPDHQALRRDDVYMPLTPMFHVHAWGLPYIATLLGLKQVYPGRYLADRIVALGEEEGVTFSHGVPTIVQMLVEALGDRTLERPWKMVVGGSALPSSLRDAARERGIMAFAGYGMSETAPVVSIARNDPGDPPGGTERCCLAGRPIPLAQVRVVDERGADAIEGELTVRAPWLTMSYGNDRHASDALWRGGWLHTQDVVQVTPRGDIVVRDRLKDVIKSGGEWISSIQLEELVMRHPQVAAAAVVGVPDDRWGERPIAFIVPAAEAPNLPAILAHLSQFVTDGIISRYALPDRLIVLDALPRTSVGKIDKKALRKLDTLGA
ncbi:long-chain-fatty-acid--CoA ligase [Sphingomonas hankookensis]|uniref:long-chain-fatty-acid--CoA ligase n=1 Tax=Sphingomonas hankookensis TaxID=563996 RepID=UPI001F584CCF|nr:long-chain-fatty-acid--CoA ligase [Sphingomonas hankookensis]